MPLRLFLLAFVLLVTGAAAQPAPKFVQLYARDPSDLTAVDYVIDRQDGHDIRLVIYTPKAAGVFPAILEIHGGGWHERQVENDRVMAERLAERGFIVALVDYRLSIEAHYPAALWDCKTGVRYLRAHARELRLDPARIGAMGGSAGGHLVGLLGTTNDVPHFEGSGPYRDQSSAVQAVIVMAAPMDVDRASKPKTAQTTIDFFGCTESENPEIYREASPLFHVGASTPPLIFIEGEKDSVKIGRREMQDKLTSLGVETALYTLKDAPHPFWMSDPWVDQVVEIAAGFFHRHLDPVKPDASPTAGAH